MRRNNIIKGIVFILLGCVTYVALPDSCPEAAKRVAFVFVIGALFWAFEVIPLFATSILVILLQTFLISIPADMSNIVNGDARFFLKPFSSPIMMLFLGGFVLATALKKHHLDQSISSLLLRGFGERPYFIMVGFMIATAFLSMWMSNTATTAMMLAMILPIIASLDHDDKFKTALALSIPFSANIGGVGTPIGTPPNAIALSLLDAQGISVSFFGWMKMTIPLVCGLLVLISFVLIFMFPPKYKKIQLKRASSNPLTGQGKLILFISITTVLLWITSGLHNIPDGIIALVLVFALVALGLIDRSDIKSVDWDILILMWGGLALGEGLNVSGLAQWITSLPIFGYQDFSLILVFSILAIFLSTVMSNTAAASLIIPLAITAAPNDFLILVVAVALSCSLAMALPISTPPNAMSFATGTIKSTDMLKSGLIISVIAIIVMVFGVATFVNLAL